MHISTLASLALLPEVVPIRLLRRVRLPRRRLLHGASSTLKSIHPFSSLRRRVTLQLHGVTCIADQMRNGAPNRAKPLFILITKAWPDDDDSSLHLAPSRFSVTLFEAISIKIIKNGGIPGEMHATRAVLRHKAAASQSAGRRTGSGRDGSLQTA